MSPEVASQADADAHRSLGEKFDVTGFPTLKFLPRGKAPTKDNAEVYNGARTAEGMLAFLQKKVCIGAWALGRMKNTKGRYHRCT